MSVYLDYNASSPIDSRVLEVMIDVYRNNIGNADSRTHYYGEQANIIVEHARQQVAQMLNIKPDEVFFTSGATESNNIAIQGLREYATQSGRKHIVTTSIEHKAVLETVKAMQRDGFEVDLVNPDLSGRVDANRIVERTNSHTLMVSLMHVNNETGIIQPIEQVGKFCAQNKIYFHIDATQSCGKLVDELRNALYDMLSFSAHKIGGPQGVGVLVLRKKHYKLPPVKAVYYGGQQERGIRPGTIPVALVAGCGKACELSLNEFADNTAKCKTIREAVLKIFVDSGLQFSINGNPDYCIANTISVCIRGVSSEALMVATKNYCAVSNGSACTSKTYSPSYVLQAMGLPEEDIGSSIRISWGSKTDIGELTVALTQMLRMAKEMFL